MPSRTRSVSPWAQQETERLLVNLLGEEHSHGDEHGKHRLVIEAYGYRWYRVGGLDYLLRRSEIDQVQHVPSRAARGRSPDIGLSGASPAQQPAAPAVAGETAEHHGV